MTLEDLTPGTAVRGLVPDATVQVVAVEWHGSDTIDLVYRRPDGQISSELRCSRDDALVNAALDVA